MRIPSNHCPRTLGRYTYDLTVYEIADTARHGFVWPYVVRYPGLLVLHDDRLHRLRSNTLRRSRRLQAYRAEFTYCHPHAAPEIAALGFAGLLGATGDFWPMRRLVLECSRLVVVDNAWRATTLQQEVAHQRFRVVVPGVSRRIPAAGDRATLRAEAGIPDDAVVFASFGHIAPQRRIRPILAALSTLGQPHLRVLACGPVESGYDPRHEAEALGVGDCFSLVPAATAAQWLRYLPAADVALCLAWPDGSEAVMPWLHCLAHGLPTIVLAVSEAVRQRIEPHLPGADLAVVPNIVDSDGVLASAAPLFGSGDPPYLLAAGKLQPTKGFHLLFEMLAQIDQEVRLLVAGDGPALGVLRAQASDLGLDATFMGWVDHDRLLGLQRDARAVILPSAWDEPLSRLVLETMGLGTPVIAWASGGNPEIIDPGETGWLVGNADDLAAALADLESADRRAQVGAAGRAHVTRCYSPDAVYPKVAAVYAEAIETAARRAG